MTGKHVRTLLEKFFIAVTVLVVGAFVLAALAFGTCLLYAVAR